MTGANFLGLSTGTAGTGSGKKGTAGTGSGRLGTAGTGSGNLGSNSASNSGTKGSLKGLRLRLFFFLRFFFRLRFFLRPSLVNPGRSEIFLRFFFLRSVVASVVVLGSSLGFIQKNLKTAGLGGSCL